MDEYLPYILTAITFVACFAFREARETPAWPILVGIIALFHLCGIAQVIGFAILILLGIVLLWFCASVLSGSVD